MSWKNPNSIYVILLPNKIWCHCIRTLISLISGALKNPSSNGELNGNDLSCSITKSAIFLTKWTLRYVHKCKIFIRKKRIMKNYEVHNSVSRRKISIVPLHWIYDTRIVITELFIQPKVRYSFHTFHKHQYSNT